MWSLNSHIRKLATDRRLLKLYLCSKGVFIESHVKEIACVFEVIAALCAELDRCSVVFRFPFFSLLLALGYRGSSFLSGWQAWLSAVTSSRSWLRGVVVLYIASCFPESSPELVALTGSPFFRSSSSKEAQKLNSTQRMLSWLQGGSQPALNLFVILVPGGSQP